MKLADFSDIDQYATRDDLDRAIAKLEARMNDRLRGVDGAIERLQNRMLKLIWVWAFTVVALVFVEVFVLTWALWVK